MKNKLKVILVLLFSSFFIFGFLGVRSNDTSWDFFQLVSTPTLDSSTPGSYAYEFSVSSDGRTLVVNAYTEAIGAYSSAGAVYIYDKVGSSWVLNTKLTSDLPANSTWFGHSVSISADGQLLVVGSSYETLGTPTSSGVVYTFKKTGGVWAKESKMASSVKVNNGSFGETVAISGDGQYLVVNEMEYANSTTGKIRTFIRSGATWTLQQTFTSPNQASSGKYGEKIAISNDGQYFIVSASAENGGLAGSGRAHIYFRNGAIWAYQQGIVSANNKSNGRFGSSVGISSDGVYVIVGASSEDGGLTGSGRAYVFERIGVTWSLLKSLVSPVPKANAYYGIAANISPDSQYLCVGASFEDGGTTGAGKIHTYSRSGNDWVFLATLISPTPLAFNQYGHNCSITNSNNSFFASSNGNNDKYLVDYTRTDVVFDAGIKIQTLLSKSSVDANFGHRSSIANSCSHILFGAPGEVISSQSNVGRAHVFKKDINGYVFQRTFQPDVTGIIDFGRANSISRDGNFIAIGSPGETTGGKVYIYKRTGDTWTQIQKLSSPNQISSGKFGMSVDLDTLGDRLVVGADQENPGAVTQAGRAYIFLRTGDTFALEGTVTSTTPLTSEYFGNGASISSDGFRLAINSRSEKHNVSTSLSSGAVFIFLRTGTTWAFEQRIDSDFPKNNGYFGGSFAGAVKLSGDANFLIIGAMSEDVGGIVGAGRAYIYSRSGTTWTKVLDLTSPNPFAPGTFGVSVAISDNGEKIIIGAGGEGSGYGKVYFYRKEGSSLVLEKTYPTWNYGAAAGAMGRGVSISPAAECAAVGADYETFNGGTRTGTGQIFNSY